MGKGFLRLVLCGAVIGSLLTGCATISDPYDTILAQKKEIKGLEAMLAERQREFETARERLAEELRSQIEEGKIKMEQLERGLVLILLEDILFDSGKVQIKPEGRDVLIKVAEVLKENVPERNISIEGHTDNEPIKYSGWKSNWELSSGRAESVLHFLIDECGIMPERLRVVGFGEYMPRVSNDTEEGRRENRRVEIVILPEKIRKVEAEFQK